MCSKCTLKNREGRSRCRVCTAERVVDVDSEGWEVMDVDVGQGGLGGSAIGGGGGGR